MEPVEEMDRKEITLQIQQICTNVGESNQGPMFTVVTREDLSEEAAFALRPER